MAEPMSLLPSEELNDNSNSALLDDDYDMTFHDPPSSPFVSHLETEDQENVAPSAHATPAKSMYKFEEAMPQSAIKVSPEKKAVLKEQASTMGASPEKNLMSEFERATSEGSAKKRMEPTGMSPLKHKTSDRFEPISESLRGRSKSPSKSSRPSAEPPSVESPTASAKDQSAEREVPELRENEGLTIAMKLAQDAHTKGQQEGGSRTSHDDDFDIDLDMEKSDFNPDGPEITSVDIDDTGFSMFSEMPGLDMTKFAFLNKNAANSEQLDATPRARVPMTPSTVRRNDDRSPSPTPRRAYKENDTTNLLIDFTEQIQSFSQSRRTSPSKGRPSSSKSVTQPDLRSYYQSKRSPAKGGSHVPSTPGQGRQMLNLLDFELPPPPTPRSLPTVTIREMESVKSQFQSQISSLTASLSGKEAEVESLSKAIADAERRVGEAHEIVRDERSAREYAEAQMEDWKKKGEEVQKLLQDVQSEMARNDSEREVLLTRLIEAERRAEEAETRASELETKVIEAESKNVDMTTFINNDSGEENKKIYSELECQTAIAEKVNEVARDLHTAYKAKHEKKIKALKDNYQKKADERCKELRLQIIRLERQVEEAEKKRDDTFSKVLPEGVAAKTEESSSSSASKPDDLEKLEKQRAEIESLKAKLAGLQSELRSLQKSNDQLLEDLETERVEKGELVAAAEQMLSLCGEKMEELQQEDLRRSTMANPPPAVQKQPAPAGNAMRNTGFLAAAPAPRPGSALGGGRPGSAIGDRSGAGVAKPSGLRAPGGFGYQGNSALNRSTSGGKSRLLSNIERMGGGGQE